MVNKENYEQEQKGHTKWLLTKNNNFDMRLLHAHAQYIYMYIVYAKYQEASVKLWYKLISQYMNYVSTSKICI